MANLTETTTYDAGVYQLETTDPVTGGAAGIANAPLKNLANRTNYLKSRVDSLESGATIPPTLAPLASPSFSGNPTAPTPALGDNDTSLATTAFVQKTVAGYLTKSVAGGVNVTLTSVEAGNGILNFTGALTANISVIVPTSPTGIWVVANNTTGAFTLTVKTAAGAGVVVTQGKSETLYCDGTSVYDADTDLLANILAVDGAGSGVDADLLDGLHGAAYARSGVNSDITSLTGLTTPLSKAQGGSGTEFGEFPAGTRIPFAQAAAPTGWTQDTSNNADNRMLRVVNTAGNGVGGSHSPILNNVVPSHTHGFTTGNVSADHSHAIGNTAHSHGMSGGYYKGPSTGGSYGAGASSSGLGYATDSAAPGITAGGISANHTHSGSTDNGSSQTNWQPRYIDLIICSKD